MDNKEINGLITRSENKRRFPIFVWIFFGMGAVALCLYIAFLFSESFSDLFNRYISSVVRAALAYATSWIPFSLGEFILILSPFVFVAVVIWGTKKFSDSWRDVIIFCVSLLSIISLILSLFVFGFAPAYRGKTLDKKLEIESREVSADELYKTAMILSEKINEEYKTVRYNDVTDFSVMPYGYDEMNDKLIEAYDKVCDEHDFVQRLDSNIKPVMLSELMSYTHITGVYSFFTGEANLNISFPDYTLPYTAAHELAHQRGIAREDEANFMAFLVCSASDDGYLRYCAYLNLYEYVASALYSASSELYYEVLDTLPAAVRYEMQAYSNFFAKYRNSPAADVSGAVNNTFLIIHGTEGTKSYGMVVDLAVAYFVPISE